MGRLKLAKSKLSTKDREVLREQGRKGGKLSGAARMAKMTPEERSAVAKIAAAAREGKRRKRRYALALPPPTVNSGRLKELEAVSPSEAFLVRRVALEGADPAELALVLDISEADVRGRVDDAIRKLNRR